MRLGKRDSISMSLLGGKYHDRYPSQIISRYRCVQCDGRTHGEVVGLSGRAEYKGRHVM
jgi:hypothetical protein